MVTKTPVRPSKPKSGSTKKKAGGSPIGAGSGSKGGGGGGGAGGAERRAVRRANAEKKKAGKRFLESAANLELQAKGLRHALKIDFAKARDQNLADVGTVLKGQISQLTLNNRLRAQSFFESAKNTEMATASTAEQGFSNLTRERADALSGILEQGAGETDTMRAQLMAARNWQANAQESNRAYFDSLASVNQGILDLNVDTRGLLANAHTASEGERDRIWTEFFNKRGETMTQLGNTLGQQADYYAQAKEMGVKPKKGAEKKAEKEMEKAWMDASKEAGKSYVQKALPKWVADYKGAASVQAKQSNTNLAASVDLGKVKKAEGASLKKWAA